MNSFNNVIFKISSCLFGLSLHAWISHTQLYHLVWFRYEIGLVIICTVLVIWGSNCSCLNFHWRQQIPQPIPSALIHGDFCNKYNVRERGLKLKYIPSLGENSWRSDLSTETQLQTAEKTVSKKKAWRTENLGANVLF